MVIWQLWISSLDIRRLGWVASGFFLFWRLGFSNDDRGLWGTRGWLDWKWEWLVDLFSHFDEALEVIFWSLLELFSVILALTIILQVIYWIAQGFAKDRQE